MTILGMYGFPDTLVMKFRALGITVETERWQQRLLDRHQDRRRGLYVVPVAFDQNYQQMARHLGALRKELNFLWDHQPIP